MKKYLILVLTALLLLLPGARADEGMWLLPLLEKINSESLRNLGSRLTPEQIYSVNHSSIKDAVVQFGGGCTGEIISGSGLLVTNYHCGYSSIQALSTTEHNYVEEGYFAKQLSEEIPAPGLTVKFLQSMTDVTSKISDENSRKKIIEEAQDANPGCIAQIVSFFNENVYYLVISKIYRDVRFVGAPPRSTGKFGGDTDNWMWPRHTCDFSMFRVYAGTDNEPAAYSKDNVPLVPKQFLNISLKGVKEGDFAMVMGYPGSTQRYQTASQLEEMLALNDIRIAARGTRQDVMRSEMDANETVNLKYTSKYAGSSNGWKKYIGMKEAFGKLGIIDREIEKEKQLTKWIESGKARIKKYGEAIKQIDTTIAKRVETYKAYTLINETLGRIEILSFATNRGNVDALYKDYDVDLDKKVALAMLEHYLDNCRPDDRIEISSATIDSLFDYSVYSSLDKLVAARTDGKDLSSDPATKIASKISTKLLSLSEPISKTRAELSAPTKAYAAALLDWSKGNSYYPDANMTCRLSYGTVKGYEPKDGVIYKHITTLKGVIEKEDPESYEFAVPERLKEIYYSNDYGRYADKNGELVTCFLTNLDITGGNSGSPVMDADGNLVGLAFDGNWEAMSGDVIFEPELQRCICVDIRYVLLIVDKFAGAGWLLDEMKLVE